MRRDFLLIGIVGLCPAVGVSQAPNLIGTWSCTSYASGGTRGSLGYTFHTHFTLRGDGSYEADGDRGRYTFDAASGRITWTEGAHTTLYGETRFERTSDGRPTIVTKIKNRRYTCTPRR